MIFKWDDRSKCCRSKKLAVLQHTHTYTHTHMHTLYKASSANKKIGPYENEIHFRIQIRWLAIHLSVEIKSKQKSKWMIHGVNTNWHSRHRMRSLWPVCAVCMAICLCVCIKSATVGGDAFTSDTYTQVQSNECRRGKADTFTECGRIHAQYTHMNANKVRREKNHHQQQQQ